jgi:hypothetical protein
MDGQTDRKTSRGTDNMWAGRQKDRQTDRQKERQSLNKQMDGQTDKKMYMQKTKGRQKD